MTQIGRCVVLSILKCVFLLRIDYCDERLVYSNGDISRTNDVTCKYYTSIESPDIPTSDIN